MALVMRMYEVVRCKNSRMLDLVDVMSYSRRMRLRLMSTLTVTVKV